MMGRLFRIGFIFVFFMFVAGIAAFYGLSYLIKSSNQVVVPKVVGKHVVPALEILSDLSLNTNVLRSEYSNDVPRHHVVYQEPAPGVALKEGRDVRIIISKGSRRLTAPNIQGLSIHQSAIILEQNGLCGGRITQTFSHEVKTDIIIAQSPGPGETIARGECVDFLVSRGERPRAYAMPNLSGIPTEEAVSLIESLQLHVGRITAKATPLFKPDVVIAQEPMPGRRIEENDSVHLVINRTMLGVASSPKSRSKLHLFKYRLEDGFLKRHIKLRLNTYGTSIDLYDEFLKPGQALWFFIPETDATSLLLFRDDVLIETKIYKTIGSEGN